MDLPGQPLHRRLSRYFWGFPPFLALVETIALAVHFQDMDMVGEAVQQSPGQALQVENRFETAVELAVMYPAFSLQYTDRWP